MNNPKYYVLQYDMMTTASYLDKYAFKAVLKKGDEDYISTLLAEKGIVCDKMDTQPEFQKCGLAIYLISICFEDYDIIKYGDHDDSTDMNFRIHPDQQEESNHSKTIIQVTNEAEPIELVITYIGAAIQTGFDIMFTAPFDGNITPTAYMNLLPMNGDAEKESNHARKKSSKNMAQVCTFVNVNN